jgi:hypothetical protein
MKTINILSFIKKNFTYLLIAILVLIIIFQRSCTSKVDSKVKTITISGTKYDVIKQHIDTVKILVTQTVYRKGNDIFHEIPNYVYVPLNIDTSNVIKRYYTLNIYKDTLHLKDSLGYVSVTDSIIRNSIVSRVWDAKVNKVVINNTNYVRQKPRTQLYFGGTLGYQKPSLTAGINLLLKTKKDQTYLIGAMYNPQLSTYFYGTMLWKISIKK